MQKGMATHSSILAWRIPWTEEPGRLQSMASQTVGHARGIKRRLKQAFIEMENLEEEMVRGREVRIRR